jgi:hypothetical protein
MDTQVPIDTKELPRLLSIPTGSFIAGAISGAFYLSKSGALSLRHVCHRSLSLRTNLHGAPHA